MTEGISEELRARGVAASTIREALGDWHKRESERIIIALAKAPATLEALLTIQAEAKAYYRLDKELISAMNNGRVED
jgi:hypothetical protein